MRRTLPIFWATKIRVIFFRYRFRHTLTLTHAEHDHAAEEELDEQASSHALVSPRGVPIVEFRAGDEGFEFLFQII